MLLFERLSVRNFQTPRPKGSLSIPSVQWVQAVAQVLSSLHKNSFDLFRASKLDLRREIHMPRYRGPLGAIFAPFCAQTPRASATKFTK